MARDSADGRPPSHRQRFAAWKWLLIVGSLLIIAGATFALARGVGIGVLVLGTLLSFGYFALAGGPSWGAGLLRRTEERKARRQATLDVRALDAAGRPAK
ncbi:MAG: hypothetical protein ACOYN0_05625 [Phycisphaerales bacterium]